MCQKLLSWRKTQRYRIRHPKVSCKKSAFKNFTKTPGKHLSWSLFLIKFQISGLRLFLRKIFSTGVFMLIFAKFLRTPFLNNTSRGCFWRWTKQNKTTTHYMLIEQLLSLTNLLWITLAARQNGQVITIFYSNQNVKWGKNKWIISFLYSFKKGKFSLEDGAKASNALPQLCHWC